MYLNFEFNTVSRPQYDYKAESDLLISEMESMATNNTKKALIEWYDNKCIARAGVEQNLRFNFLGRISYEDFTLYRLIMSYGEFESALNVWNSKRSFDLIRPTTVIQQCYYDKYDQNLNFNFHA